jgi:hypothetical protein
MTARLVLFASVGLFVGGFTSTPANAADFGISFHYSSYTPSYYSNRYDTGCYSRSYVYKDDYYEPYYACEPYYTDYCCEPLVYVGCSAPGIVVYSDRYPTTYRTTYTRSRCYSRPERRAYPSVCYNRAPSAYQCGSRKVPDYPYRSSASYRHRDSQPRPRSSVYTDRYRGLRSRSSDSYNRHHGSLRAQRGPLHGYRDRTARHPSLRDHRHRASDSRKIRR